MLSMAMDDMFENDRDAEYAKSNKHKEEGEGRRKLDSDDREKLRNELARNAHPLQQADDCKLFNIANGCVASEKVNAQEAVRIGEKMAEAFRESLPGGFYDPLHNQVVTMEIMKKGIKIGEQTLYDMEKLYGRMILIADKWKIKLLYVLGFEMSPVPPALFDEYGNMRKTSKAQLIKNLVSKNQMVQNQMQM